MCSRMFCCLEDMRGMSIRVNLGQIGRRSNGTHFCKYFSLRHKIFLLKKKPQVIYSRISSLLSCYLFFFKKKLNAQKTDGKVFFSAKRKKWVRYFLNMFGIKQDKLILKRLFFRSFHVNSHDIFF
jgi:hypothetical protein